MFRRKSKKKKFVGLTEKYLMNSLNTPSSLNDSTSLGTVTTTGDTLSQSALYNYHEQYAGARTTGPTPVYPEMNTGPWDNPSWTKEEKKAFANVGFVFNKKLKQWEIEIGTKITIPKDTGVFGWVGSDGSPTEKMIEAIKEAKEEIVKKLTAKVVLAELIKPRDIK